MGGKTMRLVVIIDEHDCGYISLGDTDKERKQSLMTALAWVMHEIDSRPTDKAYVRTIREPDYQGKIGYFTVEP